MASSVFESAWKRIRQAMNYLSLKTIGIVEVLGCVSALFLVWWWYRNAPVAFVPYTVFAILAGIPGTIGLCYHLASVLPRFRARRDTVRDYQRFCAGFDEWWYEEGWPRKVALRGFAESNGRRDFVRAPRDTCEDDLLSFRPMLSGALWSAVLLTTTFMIIANIAKDPAALDGFPLLTTHGHARSGLLFAGLGAFVSVLWRMINRIHSNALTWRFMLTSALRSVIAMIIGLTAGQTDLFGFLKSDTGIKEALFFLVGLFTDWALTTLRARARTMFNQPNSPCDRLPLCLVDGLDDGVIDVMDELGVWDIEHLATSEPAELTIRTLCPFNRVIDWIDQAILISYVRSNIAVVRTFGISGAIDLAFLYSYTIQEHDPAANDRANRTLDELANRMNVSRNVLELIASNLWFDYTIEQLYRFWQHPRTPHQSKFNNLSGSPDLTCA